MGKRERIEAQIADLLQKASQRPMGQDGAGMIGFAATLLAAQMQAMLLQADVSGSKPTNDDQQSTQVDEVDNV